MAAVQQPEAPAAPHDPDHDPDAIVGPWQAAPNHAPWVPEWTDPEWSENVEYSLRGDRRRDRYVNTGTILRPAVLPRDQAKNPTDFARRFGVYPKMRPSDPDPDVGRSLITPRIGPGQPPPHPSGDDEVWQAVVFGGPTTKEMIDTGVYDPNHQLTRLPHAGDLHPLFTRDRWLDSRTASQFLPQSISNTRWKFGGPEGLYDPADERIWAALEPALRLAGRVIASNHPYWNALVSLYHARPVPDDVDGRTDEARQRSGAPFMSLWLDENRPGMYTQAAELRQLGFRSRETAEAILHQYLRFAIGTWEPVFRSNAVTFCLGTNIPEGGRFPPEPRIVVIIHPRSVWQLVTTDFPEARAAAAFNLAVLVLHEMSHACRMANELLLRQTEFTLRHLPDAVVTNLGITPEMAARFRPLGLAMHGPDILESQQYFFQDGPQCEEGKEFENQTWGGTISFGHPAGPESEIQLRPFIQVVSWPQSHLAPDLQHLEVDKSFYVPYSTGAYSAYLLNPPAPAYDQRRLVPVEDYAKFFREDWWQDVFQRFGHQSLKFLPTSNSLMVLESRETSLLYKEVRRELGLEDYNYIAAEAFPLLTDANQSILNLWLLAETKDLVLYQATYRRLYYEARTWTGTYGRLDSLFDKSTSDLDQLGAAIVGWVADSTAGRLQTDASQQAVKTAFDQATSTIISDDLLALDRLVMYAIQYAQSVIAIYSLVPGEPQRRTLHQAYMRPLRDHLSAVRDKLVALLQKLQTFVTYISSIDGQFFLAQFFQGLLDLISFFRQAVDTSGAILEDTIGLLADDLIAPGFDYSRHPRTLPFVPDARKRLSMKAIMSRASVRPLTYLTASGRSRVLDAVRRWSTIVLNQRNRQEAASARAAQLSPTSQFPQMFVDRGNAPQASGAGGDAAQVFAVMWNNIQGM